MQFQHVSSGQNYTKFNENYNNLDSRIFIAIKILL